MNFKKTQFDSKYNLNELKTGVDDSRLTEKSKKLLRKEDSKANLFKKKLGGYTKTGVKTLFKSMKGMFGNKKE